MKNKIAITAGVITVGVLITGIAFAIQDAGPTGAASLAEGQTVTLPAEEDSMVEATSTTNRTSTTGQTSGTGATPTANPAADEDGTSVLADGQTNTIVVADGGSVLLRRDGGTLTIVSTEPNPGWVVEVEVAEGREVEGTSAAGVGGSSSISNSKTESSEPTSKRRARLRAPTRRQSPTRPLLARLLLPAPPPPTR